MGFKLISVISQMPPEIHVLCSIHDPCLLVIFQETKAALDGNQTATSDAARRRQFDLSQSGLSSSDVKALHERLSNTFRDVGCFKFA